MRIVDVISDVCSSDLRVTHDDLSVRNCSICLAIHEQALLLIQGCGVREQLVVVGVSGHSRSRQLVLHIADVDELAVGDKGKVGRKGDDRKGGVEGKGECGSVRSGGGCKCKKKN